MLVIALKKTKRKIWSLSFFPVLLTYFIDTFGQAIVYPIFTPLLLRPHLDFLGVNISFLHRTILLGLLIASFPLARFFGAPLLGTISDRVGRKKVFLVTITGGIIGYFLTGLGVHLQILTLLWAGRICAGFFAGNLTLCLAAIADISHTKQERTKNFGWIGTLAGLSFVFAILIGSSLSNPHLNPFFRPEIPFFFTSLLLLVNLGFVFWFFKESKRDTPHDKSDFYEGLGTIGSAFISPKLRLIYITYFLFILSWGISLQFLSTYLMRDFHVTPNTLTFAFVFIGVSWSFANFILHPLLSRHLNPITIFTFGLALLTLTLFLTLIPHQPLFLFLIHIFIAAFSAGLCWTNGLVTLSLKASATTQGSILGVNQSLVAIAFILGPILGGILSGVDIHKLYVFTATCTLVGTCLLLNRTFGIKKL